MSDQQPRGPANLAGLRVLVVDDNSDALESLAMLLQVHSADVTTAGDAAQAMAAFGARRPAVVLLDIGMPGVSGYDLARWIREQPQGRDVKLIALTGWGDERDRRRSADVGIDHHLVKPVDFGSLEALLVEPSS